MQDNNFVILDGAMGTMLQTAGLPVGYPPELWNLECPDKITAVQKQYVAAGSDIIYANTFGANRHKLPDSDISAVIEAGVNAAKAAAEGTDTKVALDIGPIGQLMEPLGTLKFDEAYDIFREMVTAGEKAGADLIVFETMSDLYELKAGILAVKENTKLPIYATMTFEKNARTFVGVTVPTMALTLQGLGVDAIGFNCGLGPKEILPLVKELRRWTKLPIIVKPNAGLPDPETGEYTLSCDDFAAEICAAADEGGVMFGGCCGTTPQFISALKNALSNKKPLSAPEETAQGVCSGTRAVELNSVRVIGERINPTGKKRFQQALKDNDIGYILGQGIEQQEAGADILDVNVGLPDIDEPKMMKNIVKQLQAVVDLPLQIDSSDIAAIEQGIRYYNGKPIVNSVNGEESSLNTILPLCKKYGAAVVGLTMDKNGIPQTAEERIEIAKRILDSTLSYGLPREDVYIDCLTLTVSAQQEQAEETLKAVKYVKENLGLHTVLGVSNISFGLPEREHITVSFLTQAMSAGLDLPIVNPNQNAIMGAILAKKVLSGEDAQSQGYIEKFAQNKTATITEPTAEMTVSEAISKGLREQTAALTQKALETMDELSVVNSLLIPALDLVGEKYEKQEIFLPQLINSANAACEGFEVIKKSIAQKGKETVSKGKILLATVKGDIHDIGKNIVKVVLQNYGYTVLDLGRDVDPEIIVETAIREDIKLVGLSALMTTTVVNMEKTIAALRESRHKCKIFVGGAVLTPDYAAKIGADFYSKDAKESADIAKKVLG